MLKQLTKRVYYKDFVQETDRPVLGLIVGDTYSLVVDGGNSRAHAEEFLQEIQQLNVPPVRYVILTHWHWDHVFGLEMFPNAIIIAERRTEEKLQWLRTLSWTNEAIEQRVQTGEEIQFCYDHIQVELPSSERDINIAATDVIYDDHLTIELGGLTVELQHVGGDHAADSVVVHIKEENVLFVGDALYLDMYHGPWSYSREKLFPLLQTLTAYNAQFYVPCHHPLYTGEQFAEFQNYIERIGNTVGSLDDMEKAVQQFKETYNREPNEEEHEDMMGFVEANRKKIK